MKIMDFEQTFMPYLYHLFGVPKSEAHNYI